MLYPDLRRDPRRSPALRSYLPGENLDCMVLVYNAKSKKGQKPDLESQFTLYENGKALFKSRPEQVDLSKVTDFKRIPIALKLRLGDSIPPGDYAMLFQVTDKLADKKHNVATQALDFRAVAKSEALPSKD